MSEDKKARLQNKLEAGRQKYADKLPARLTKVETTWAALLNDSQNQDLLETLHRQLHTLAGSGQTFGFGAMGQVARETEVLLKSVMQEECLLAEIEQDVRQYLDRLPKTAKKP